MRHNTLYVYRYKGQWKSMSDWAKEYGLPYYVLRKRIEKLGWSMKDALTTPCRPWGT
jgi:hypothetical protein